MSLMVSILRAALFCFCAGILRTGDFTDYQTVCQYLTRAGLSVLAIDPIGQGERLSYYEPKLGRETVESGTCEHDYAGAQSWPLGDSIARYFLHDIMRGIDYLCTRPEVDPGKIGITGNSGGGTQTAMAMLCDPRIAAAAPGTFIMNRESYMFAGQAQDAEQIWPGMTALGFDHEDLLLAMAPRPVMVLAVQYDFFPIEGTRRTVKRCRRFWDTPGKADNLQLVEDDSEHGYSVPLAKAAAAFFAKHLLGTAVSLDEVKIELPEDRTLWSTDTGQVRGDFPGARAVHEENIDRLDLLEKCRESKPDEVRRKEAATWLEHKVIHPRKACELNPRFEAVGQLGELLCATLLVAEPGETV